MKRYERIGIVYHGLLPEAAELVRSLTARFSDGRRWWAATQDTLAEVASELERTDLVVTIGGDGTILRGSHLAAPMAVPVLGINMGRVGFMSEIDADEALEGLGWYLDGNARVEERSMLRGEIVGDGAPLDALNDLTLARGAMLRVIEVDTRVDGVDVATYRGDGVVVSTATGSTGYTLSLGGPVMDPTSDDYLVKPIATHMSQFGGVILQSTSSLELTVHCPSPATLSADGFIDRTLNDGEMVRIGHSPFQARFLRKNPRSAFWASLSRRLGMRPGALPRRTRAESDFDTIEAS